MAVPDHVRTTAAEYLAHERLASQKHEMLDGQVFAMAGASREHIRIVRNIPLTLEPVLRTQGCESFGSDMRVRVDEDAYFYPDLTIVCGETQFEDAEVDVLLNPLVVFEVLSPSTERFDRGAKFRRYRTIPSLQAVVFLDSTAPVVEVFSRPTWGVETFEGLDAVVRIELLGVEIAMREIYFGVQFAAEEEAPSP